MIVMLVPYVSDYLFFTLLLGIAQNNPERRCARNPVLWALGMTLLGAVMAYLAFLPGAWYFLFLLATIPSLFAQNEVNAYWDKVEQGENLIVRKAFSGKEIFATLAGALVVGFLISSFILIPNK